MKKLTVLFLSAAALLLMCALTPTNETTWYTFEPAGLQPDAVINTSDWLEAPAGSHGFLTLDGDGYRFEDGTPVKFWGANICSGKPFVDNETAEQWADYLAFYGVNSVRFHKFTRNAMEGMPVSTELEADKFNRMDYFSNELRERGIYYCWSHIYGHRPQPGDSSRLLAYDEIINAGSGHLKGSTIGLVNFAPDVQDLSIELTVNMLNHVNPYTGLRYADDPALTFIEFQNEDNIFFATTAQWLQECPTYKAMLSKRFSLWLVEKYGSQGKLLQAWGEDAIDCFPEYMTGEHLDSLNIFPTAHHWFLGSEAMANDDWRPRLLDTARFLFEVQMEFYEKFEAAIRETGYKGTLVGSCWQAGDHVAHYYNLYADAAVGTVDRHNYYGGGAGGHSLKPGEVKHENKAMISTPGAGPLGTGLQQVDSRPFALSEWMSLTPNEWIPEVAPIIAVYGMGLQGWDGSYSFASNEPQLTNTVEASSHGVYNADSPFHMGLYPVFARMIYRGDVKEASTLAVKNVHIPSLAEGNIGFTEIVKQNQDEKQFGGVVPPAALAAVRTAIRFTEEFTPTNSPDLEPFIDKEKKVVTSETGELHWDYSGKGYFTLDSDGTAAVAGFTPSSEIELSNASLTIDNDFAIVFMTALQEEATMHDAGSLLLTTIARVRNTGMEYNDDHTELLATGSAPLQLEAVDLSVRFNRPVKEIRALDHGGNRTGKTIAVTNNTAVIKGAETKTFYYEIVF